MKKVIVYSCVTEAEETDPQVIRFSLSRDITSDPTKEAPVFKGRVAAGFTDESGWFTCWNSCRSGEQPCTAGGNWMGCLSNGQDMIDWLTGVADLIDDPEATFPSINEPILVRRGRR